MMMMMMVVVVMMKMKMTTCGCGDRNNVRYVLYEGRLQSSWTDVITPSRNFVEVR